jgi:hypothetical protein
MSEGVKILYKDAVDNIIFLKRQQWVITNYALVVYAAVVALAKSANPIESTLLTLVASLACAYGTYCMVHTQLSLTKMRTRLAYVYQNFFAADERSAFELWASRPTFNYGPGFIYGLMFANTLAFAATVYLIWRNTPAGAVA